MTRNECLELATEKFADLSFNRKKIVLTDLARKVFVWGAYEANGQFVQLGLKHDANMNNVKAILRNYFDIEYYLKFAWETCQDERYASKDDIFRLVKIYLRFNVVPLGYYNKYDPLRKKDTVSKVIYQYGKIDYHRLCV